MVEIETLSFWWISHVIMQIALCSESPPSSFIRLPAVFFFFFAPPLYDCCSDDYDDEDDDDPPHSTIRYVRHPTRSEEGILIIASQQRWALDGKCLLGSVFLCVKSLSHDHRPLFRLTITLSPHLQPTEHVQQIPSTDIRRSSRKHLMRWMRLKLKQFHPQNEI